VHRAQRLLAGRDDHRVGEDDVEHLIGDLDGHLTAARLFRLLVACALHLRGAELFPQLVNVHAKRRESP
jgi:hypothetical protein